MNNVNFPAGNRFSIEGLVRCVVATTLLFAAAVVLCAATGIDTQQQAAFPEIIGVNTTFDATSGADDAFPGDGQCETAVGNGVCTLRAAIEESNAHGGNDGIFFSIPTSDPGYSNGTWTINVVEALPDISDGANINGPGEDKLTVQHSVGYGPFRVFNVTTTGTVNFSGLTIAHGQTTNGNQGNIGSAIRNLNGGTVNITKCVFVDNYITAIHNNGGTMNITECIITGGNTAYNGGGIYNNATLTVKNTTISGNFAYFGGGIWSSGIANLIGCTISGNFADSDSNSKGGGIYNEITTGNMNITGCTITGNESSGDGGGIYDGNKMNITNSTVSGNSSGRAFASGGAAIAVGPYGGTVLNIKSTIVALNTNTTSGSLGPDVYGPFSSAGFNLIGKTDGSTGFTASTDLTGTLAAPLNPKLGVLKDNGGPTNTMALLSGSPAVDKGSSASLTGTLTTDQRGVGYKRTINKSVANATGGDGADIGAFELGAQINAVSSKAHGSAGIFNINLPLFGPKVGIECRKGGSSGIFKLILTFPSAVTVSDATVTPDPAKSGATASISSFSVSGSKVTVNLTGVSQAQTIVVHLLGVSDGTNTNDVSVPMGVLLGDTDSNRSVTSNDVSLTQSKIGQALSTSNFREDVNLDGAINSTDVNLVKPKVGTKLP